MGGDISSDEGALWHPGLSNQRAAQKEISESYAGFTILTDPTFLHAGDHMHLSHGDTYEFEVSGVSSGNGCHNLADADIMTPHGRFADRPCNEPPFSQRLLQTVVAVALRVIRDVCDDFVAELLVERLCLKTERSQKDSVASLHPGFVFCGPE